MKEKLSSKNDLGSCQSAEGGKKKAKQGRATSPKPHWPAGLPLPPSKDITCFIPENLAVILSRKAFEQLFGYAYSTSSEICCLGTVTQEGERFRTERFYLSPQSGSLGHTVLDEGAVAGLMEELIAQGKAEEAPSLKCWAHSRPLCTADPAFPAPASGEQSLLDRQGRRRIRVGQRRLFLPWSKDGGWPRRRSIRIGRTETWGLSAHAWVSLPLSAGGWGWSLGPSDSLSAAWPTSGCLVPRPQSGGATSSGFAVRGWLGPPILRLCSGW